MLMFLIRIYVHSTLVYLDSAWIETDKISASCSPDLRKSCLKGTLGVFGYCLIFSAFIYFLNKWQGYGV